jgi:hypothetical protein
VLKTNLALWWVGAFATTAMAKAVTPREWRMMEALLKYLSSLTPRVLRRACEMRRAA